MTTDVVKTPNDAYRAGCDAALRMLALAHDWRHEWHALMGRRIERDRSAVRRMQEALAEAKEWGVFGEAVRDVLRDYAAVSTAIWEDAGELFLRAQYESASAWRTLLRESQAGWVPRIQTDWFPDLSRLAAVNEASMPWRDWMEAIERGMTGAVRPDGGAPNASISARRGDGAKATQERAHVR
ncbi:hypothetical protein WI90_21255 [Burkholderia ubonensis]|uniref:hypothetical protein n=1 Tax=Burkholderia ubonensis TaxID=101571 RepID=UPI00075A9B37|nr:hypothetical protein [Burkholderia ubonensis]KVD88335.1 hypothetical protein WI90_21255 [Burkholderia ubonensis]